MVLAYEAFAVLVGLLLMQHRWPQGTAVRLMREARPTLEPEHARILGQDPKELFDPVQIEKQAAPGMMAVDTTDPVFLAIVTAGRSEAAKAEGAPHAVRVCRGEADLMSFMRQNAPPGMSMTSIEVARLAHTPRRLASPKPNLNAAAAAAADRRRLFMAARRI